MPLHGHDPLLYRMNPRLELSSHRKRLILEVQRPPYSHQVIQDLCKRLRIRVHEGGSQSHSRSQLLDNAIVDRTHFAQTLRDNHIWTQLVELLFVDRIEAGARRQVLADLSVHSGRRRKLDRRRRELRQVFNQQGRVVTLV